MTQKTDPIQPIIAPLGLAALNIRFSRTASDAASAAVQVFCNILGAENIRGITEIVPALASVMVSFDPKLIDRSTLWSRLDRLIGLRKWGDLPVPKPARQWNIPVSVDPRAAPDLGAVAEIIGCSTQSVIDELVATDLTVLAIGFAPGQPYIGLLPNRWDMPRTSQITDQVPAGSLVTAVRQLVLFANASPTGWRQIGLTAFRPYDLGRAPAILLQAGDGIKFSIASYDEISALRLAGDPMGGAICKHAT